MANYDPLSFSQLVDSSGNPAASAKIYFFETGSTTPKAVYSDAGLTSAISQPVTASSTGIVPVVYLSAGRYKRSVTTSAGTTLSAYAADPIDASLEKFSASAAPSTTYPFLEYHNTSDGHLYRRNSTDSAWIDLGTVDSLGNAATVAQQLAGTSTSVFNTPDSTAALWQRGSDIASASTLSLPSTGGGVFNVTGTTTITGISTAAGGRTVRLKFASGLKLTYNATSLILPGAADLTVAAGDVLEFTNEASADGATGANWRCTDILFANHVPLQAPLSAAKTTNYTVTDADRGSSIKFSGMSGDSTLTLPAAAGRAGFMIWVSNEDTADATPFGVIVDPNASETIDGFTTRKGYFGTRVGIICDGSNWRTVAGNWRYFSGDQTWTAAGALTLAHGLGVRPKMCWGELKCASAEAGYSVGDIAAWFNLEVGSTNGGVNMVLDATNVNVRYGSSATIGGLNKTTGAGVNLTAASWKYRVYAQD